MRKRISMTSAILALLAGAASADPPLITYDVMKPEAKIHFDAAKKSAGNDFIIGLYANCNPALPRKLQVRTRDEVPSSAAEPAKVFDNLYFLGDPHVSSWAVTTSQGIILIDALNNQDDAKHYIEDGLRKLGLDPAQIKYILITHAHGDHFGGAQYLADRYHAHVLMSAADWEFIQIPNPYNHPEFGPNPRHDLTVTDGQKLSLGGEALTIVATPGHTPGTVSVLIPVTDRGQPHVVALWGGNGLSRGGDRDENLPKYKQYAISAETFAHAALKAGADVPLANHEVFDQTFAKLALLQRRGPSDPNPFVMGQDGVKRFLTTSEECAKTFVVQASR
jgi:metallo-beta-lactamase class B